jgi:hypothetical protein
VPFLEKTGCLAFLAERQGTELTRPTKSSTCNGKMPSMPAATMPQKIEAYP